MIIGIGNALVDIMTRLSNDNLLESLSFPKGSMQLVDKESSDLVLKKTEGLPQSLASGGSAANTIHGLARLGVATTFLGKIGNDTFGSFFRDDMEKSGIKPVLFTSKTESGRAIAMVSTDSERTFATYLGAAVELCQEDLKSEYFAGHKYFHIEGYLVQNHSLMLKAAQLAKKNGLIISLDMASFNVVEGNRDFLESFIREYIDIVFANEEESFSFTGKEPEQALGLIAGMCDIAVVKIGKKGSLVQQGKNKYQVGVIPVTSVDTTGAGDLFASGFLYGLTKKLSLDICAQIGAVLGGKVIEVIGAKLSDKQWEDAQKMIKEIETKRMV